MAPLKNKTHSIGQTLSLVCNATAEPNPTFIWYKNEEHIDGQVEMELVISELTENDTGWYNCMAGNWVVNLTFDAAFVNVTGIINLHVPVFMV